MKTLWLTATLVAALTACSTPTPPPAAQTLKKPALDRIAAAPAAAAAAEFRQFLALAAQMQPQLQTAVSAYLAHKPLVGDDLVNISRLLGLHNRLRNQAAVIDATAKMVAIPTVRADKVPPHEDKHIIAFGALVEGMAKDFGLQYRNVDNRIFEVKLPGSGPEEFGILTHADVVPVVADEWVLDDGTKLDPFQLTRVGGNLYGRGSIDDKGSIATVLFAMKAVKDSGLPLARTIRLMIETTEETGGDAMKYYRAKTSLPEYNIVLDSKYPAVVAEKGSGALRASFPLPPTANPGATAITAMAGAASANAVPQTATARLQGGNLADVAARLNAAKGAFVAKYQPQGGAFSIDVAQDGGAVVVKVTGASAHGSRPEEGVNPLPRLALFLKESGLALAPNGYAQAVRYLTDLYGTDYLGRTMGLAYSDDFMGPLTMSPNLIREKDGKVDVLVNVRMPRGNTPEALTKATTERIKAWGAQAGVPVEVDHNQGNWMARDPQGAWLATLLNTFGDTTGLKAKPVPTAGSTTAKLMPNAINFGPAMPGKKYTAHNAKEFKEVADLDADMQMFTEMLVRIGNLPKMQ
ncbi:putative dipeptidase [Acidovorax delafieldii]|uniref:dipeptidase n=1 Tax=Acidovorax delafieldii TaxID=47920 RepID=UPI00285CBEE4|nr:dipeptidase [Acidovorax delafieldii]MDR6156287.1 putative dipeptidase [Acidovorax delafieldii]